MEKLFFILTAQSYTELIDLINEHIQLGYLPHGDMFITTNYDRESGEDKSCVSHSMVHRKIFDSIFSVKTMLNTK